MIKNQSSKVIVGLVFIIALVGLGSVALKKYLAYQEVKSQTLIVEKSSKALQSYLDNYFQCNELSKKTLEKFVNNHELKIRRLMFLKNEDFVKLEQELDNLKLRAQEKLKSCESL